MTVYIILVSVYFTMILIENRFPAQKFDKPPFWWTRAIFFNAIQLILSLSAGFTWDKWMHGASLINSQELFGTTGSVIFGYLVITFVFYWWHRLRHDIDFLWLYLHQIHHSPRRIEIVTSFYKHPLEIIVDAIMTSAILYLVLGLSPKAATITLATAGIAEMIYHWNIKTPYWMGFIFQRPEMHLVHHKEGWHHNNYSDLPIWDMLFGTFANPRTFEAKCGFKDNRELKVSEMLRFIDVNPRTKKKDLEVERQPRPDNY